MAFTKLVNADQMQCNAEKHSCVRQNWHTIHNLVDSHQREMPSRKTWT